MRNAFASKITELAHTDDRTVLIAADIGNRMFDKFKMRFQNRFYNCGIAEQCMIGIAAGMASSGLRPVTYTITPFTTLRCFEQLRNDIAYPCLPVIIIGTGAGLSYANLGVTHHSLEDIALIRTLPNFQIYCPGDAREVELCLELAFDSDKPSYIRLGKKGEPVIHNSAPAKLDPGDSLPIKSGDKGLLLSMGNMLPIVCEASEILQKRGLRFSVHSALSVNPLPNKVIDAAIVKNQKIFIIEEHYLNGGLGSAVLEYVNHVHRGNENLIYRIGYDLKFLSGPGSQDEVRESHSMNSDSLADRIAFLFDL